MAAKRVELDFGMKRDARSIELREVRLARFPHVDEPYDTGCCLPERESYARVYVCPRCTEALSVWLSTHRSNP